MRQKSRRFRNKRKSLKGGGCISLGVRELAPGGYANMYGVPLNVLEFCTFWVINGNNVCLDQGGRQTDTLYLSKGPMHDSTNHIHLFNFKDGVKCGVKDKRTNQTGTLQLTRDIFLDLYGSWIQRLS